MRFILLLLSAAAAIGVRMIAVDQLGNTFVDDNYGSDYSVDDSDGPDYSGDEDYGSDDSDESYDADGTNEEYGVHSTVFHPVPVAPAAITHDQEVVDVFERSTELLAQAGLPTIYFAFGEIQAPSSAGWQANDDDAAGRRAMVQEALGGLEFAFLKLYPPALALAAELRLFGNRQVMSASDFRSFVIPFAEADVSPYDLRRRCFDQLWSSARGMSDSDENKDVLGHERGGNDTRTMHISLGTQSDAIVALVVAQCMLHQALMTTTLQASFGDFRTQLVTIMAHLGVPDDIRVGDEEFTLTKRPDGSLEFTHGSVAAVLVRPNGSLEYSLGEPIVTVLADGSLDYATGDPAPQAADVDVKPRVSREQLAAWYAELAEHLSGSPLQEYRYTFVDTGVTLSPPAVLRSNLTVVPQLLEGGNLYRYIPACLGLAVRTDLIENLQPLEPVALRDTTTVLALLHLAKLRVDAAALDRLLGHRAVGDLSSVELEHASFLVEATGATGSGLQQWWRTSASVVDSFLHGIQLLVAAVNPSTPNSAPHTVGASSTRASNTVTIFPSDVDAENTLAFLGQEGNDLSALVVANRVLSGLPVGTTGLKDVNRESVCSRLMELVLPIAQDAMMGGEGDGAAASLLHVDTEMPHMWEAHEDAEVMTAAVEEDMNVEFVRQLAGDGDEMANLQMGELLSYGYPRGGLAADPVAAQHHLQIAANAGNPHARAALATLILNGSQDAANATRAKALLEAAAADGSVEAMAGLGYLYQSGHGNIIPKNMTLALHYLRLAADAGLPNAHSNLGAMYLQAVNGGDDDDEVPFNATAARYHLEQAVAAQFIPAFYNLGMMEMYGWDRRGIRNCSGAVRLWREVAQRARWRETALFSAQAAFAMLKLGDVGDVQETVLRHHLVLAAIGSLRALEDAGFMLDTFQRAGYVVDVSVAAAWPWNRSSVHARTRNKDLESQQQQQHSRWLLRVPYIDGSVTGFHADPVQPQPPSSMSQPTVRGFAAQVYLAAALQGSPYAAKRMGDCVAEGWPDASWCARGNVEEALAWYATATSNDLAHATFEVAQSHMSGTLGRFRVPVNFTLAWELLDGCLAADFLADWPVSLAKMRLVGTWVASEVTNGWNHPMRVVEGLLAPLWECVLSWKEAESDSEDPALAPTATSTGTYGGGGEPGHRSFYSSAYGGGDEYEEDWDGEGQDAAAQEMAHMQKRGAQLQLRADLMRKQRFLVGPLPLTLEDRQLCSVLTRTAVGLVVGIAALLLLAFVGVRMA